MMVTNGGPAVSLPPPRADGKFGLVHNPMLVVWRWTPRGWEAVASADDWPMANALLFERGGRVVLPFRQRPGPEHVGGAERGGVIRDR